MRTMMASMKAAFFLFLHWGEFIRTSLTICHMVVHLRDCTVTEYTVYLNILYSRWLNFHDLVHYVLVSLLYL